MGLKTRAGMPNFAIGALYRGTGLPRNQLLLRADWRYA